MAVNRRSGRLGRMFSWWTLLCLTIAAITFTSQPALATDAAIEAALNPATIGKSLDGKPLVDVAVPPGVDESIIKPRTGEMLERAMLPLEKIIPQIKKPNYIPAANTKGANLDPAERVDQRIKELKAALEAKPKDRIAAGELLRLYLIDKDDPASALPLLDLGADLKARVHLPLAAKAVGDLKENELLDLAIWYQELGDKTQGSAGEKMLRRAYGYYEAFLKAHTAADIQNATARVALLKVHQAIEARTAVAAKPKGPSLHVQRTYAQARAAWREGQPHVAINLLEAANNLAPNQPEILQLLGHIYFNDLRNAVQGAHYTKQVLALNPNDLDSLFLLGRYEFLHLRQWNNAIAVFAHALTLDAKDADAALPLLIHNYLGRALQNEGYDAASIAEFEKFLDSAQYMGRPSQYMQEVALFGRTLPIAWQQVGDAHHRLNNPQAALAAYQEAAKLDPEDRFTLVNRIAYTQLRLGRSAEALKAVVELLKSTNGDKASLALLNYLVDTGANAKELAGELKRIYIQLERPSALALALANMQGGSEGLATLREHLLANPLDREVYQTWLELNFAAKQDSATADATQLTAQLITKSPITADRYGDLLLDAAAKPEEVLKVIEGLDAGERAKPVMRLLKAMAMLRAGQDDGAIEEFAAAVAADASLVSAQVTLIKLLVDRREYERAEKALAAVKKTDDPRLLQLRIRMLRETNKVTEAIVLLDGLSAVQRRSPEIIIEKARLQLTAGDIGGAERTLEDGIDANPTAEPLYDSLLDLLDQRETPEAQRQIVRITERMLRQIPQSTAAQVRKAQLLIRARDIAGAERTLRDVQKDHPTDGRSLALLTQILFFTDRKPEADELITGKLKAYPRSDEVSAVALQLARLHIQSGDPGRAIEITTSLLENRTTVTDPRPLVTLTRLAMIRAKKFDAIDKTFSRMVELYPKHAADILSDWALAWEYAGEKAKSEKLLEQALEKDPNHPKVNNALGYSWADQGINLERAEKMIAIALKSEPDNSAYLDSMGWVKYKLGKFDEAVKHLEKAVAEEGGDHAVILDHLGDALYRAGRQADALAWWLKAQGSIDPEDLDLDLELRSVSKTLREKIGAVRATKEPVTAQVPKKEEKKD